MSDDDTRRPTGVSDYFGKEELWERTGAQVTNPALEASDNFFTIEITCYDTMFPSKIPTIICDAFQKYVRFVKNICVKNM